MKERKENKQKEGNFGNNGGHNVVHGNNGGRNGGNGHYEGHGPNGGFGRPPRRKKHHYMRNFLLFVIFVIVVAIIVVFAVKHLKVTGSTSAGDSIVSVTAPVIDDPVEQELVDNASGTENGHDYVDLGLSVKWATCNVGAETPSQYGDYYAWGKGETSKKYTKATCYTFGRTINDIAGDAERDAAQVNWGGKWRMPTKEECEELVSKCKGEWTTVGTHDGYIVTGKNGKRIFLPAAGSRTNTDYYATSEMGYYWSSTPDTEDTRRAFALTFNDKDFLKNWPLRYCGQSVRAVLPI
ncbi:MAG: DUF1566 domain-containing protein [Prevotella sp.]|nr:DUF1566 domain-containing protein [Prevotella sp.]